MAGNLIAKIVVKNDSVIHEQCSLHVHVWENFLLPCNAAKFIQYGCQSKISTFSRLYKCLIWFSLFFFLLSFPLIMQMFSPPTGEGGRKNGNVAASEHHSASNYKQGNNTDFNHCLLFVVLLQLLYYIILTLYMTRQSIWPCLSWIDCHVLKCRGRIRLICKFATWCRNNKTYNNCQIYHNTPIPLNTCTYSGILKVVWEY